MSDSSTDTVTAPAEGLAVEVRMESPSACSRRLSITIPASEVDRRMEEAFVSVQRDTVLPGFRRGKVPRALLERRIGSELAKETRDRLLGEALSAAVRKENLKPLGDPELPENMTPADLERGKDYTFEIEIEVMPEFELPAFEGLKIKKPVGQVAEDAVDRELDRQKRWFGNPERITGPFETLDRMIGEVKVFREDGTEPFFTADDALATVPGDEDGGRGQFLGVLVEGLAGLLKGRKVGDDVVIETVGPEGHEMPEVRGAKLRMEYRIRDAERIHPASEEEVAGAIGVPSVEDLRPQIRLALEDRMAAEQRGVMREQVAEQLVKSITMDLPEKLSSRQATAIVERRRAELLGRGLDPEALETELARFRETSAARSRDQLKLSLVLAKVAETFGVSVGENEVNNRIARMARQRGERPDQLRAELAKSNRIASIALEMREQKALDRIIDKAEVAEVSLEEWNESVKKRQDK